MKMIWIMLQHLQYSARITDHLHGDKDAHEAVHNAVVLEEVAKMAARCEMINPDVKPAPQELQDKHYFRNMEQMLIMDSQGNK